MSDQKDKTVEAGLTRRNLLRGAVAAGAASVLGPLTHGADEKAATVAFFHAGPTPKDVPEAEIFGNLLAALPTWWSARKA